MQDAARIHDEWPWSDHKYKKLSCKSHVSTDRNNDVLLPVSGPGEEWRGWEESFFKANVVKLGRCADTKVGSVDKEDRVYLDTE